MKTESRPGHKPRGGGHQRAPRSEQRGLRPVAWGFTLIEMMIALSVVALLLGLASPAVSHFVSRSRLRGATEDVRGDLYLARTTAILRHQDVYAVFYSDDAHWCYTVTTLADCSCVHCSDPSALLKQSDSSHYAGIAMLKASGEQGAKFAGGGCAGLPCTRFDHRYGMALGRNGSIYLGSAEAGHNQILVAGSGRIRLCRHDGDANTALPDC